MNDIEYSLNAEYDVVVSDGGITITDGETNAMILNRDDAIRLMAILSQAILGPLA